MLIVFFFFFFHFYCFFFFFIFNYNTILRVLVFGHSFVRKLLEFVFENQYSGCSTFRWTSVILRPNLLGIGGTTVRPGPKSIQNTRNMNIILSYNPDMILKIAMSIQRNFANFIIECYDVKHVIIDQLFRRYSRRIMRFTYLSIYMSIT